MTKLLFHLPSILLYLAFLISMLKSIEIRSLLYMDGHSCVVCCDVLCDSFINVRKVL